MVAKRHRWLRLSGNQLKIPALVSMTIDHIGVLLFPSVPVLRLIGRRLELPPEEVTTAMDAIAAPVSFCEPVYSDGGDPLTVMDQLRNQKNTDEHWIERIALCDAIAKLGEREHRILALRFYDGRTQMEVAQSIGISQAQVSLLEKTPCPPISTYWAVTPSETLPMLRTPPSYIASAKRLAHNWKSTV